MPVEDLCSHLVLSARDQESVYVEKIQSLHQQYQSDRDKELMNSSHQRSLLEDSLMSTKTEEQRLRQKLSEAEEVCVAI